ncbi:hypothetical protein BH09ACT12_BH09ACT12_20620 [soil metagenome]
MADPAVTGFPGVGYVAFATGPRVSRYVSARIGGPWEHLDAALPYDAVPAWMRQPDGSHTAATIWAPEIVHDTAFGRDRWLLYYAAIPRPGLRGGNPSYRCISVAVASDPLGDFDTPRSLQRAPLYCLPGSPGIIDPSVLQVGNDAYLLYKTRSLPARLRIAQLTRDRLGLVPGSQRDLVSDATDVIENPVIQQFGNRFVLFASHGHYRSCRYRTDYWVAGRGLQFQGPARTLLSHDGRGRRTSVCGPGGADIVGPPHHRVLVFHGTLVSRGARWVPGIRDDADVRTLYGVNLTFNHRLDRPMLGTWLQRVPPKRPSAQRLKPMLPRAGTGRSPSQAAPRAPGASRLSATPAPAAAAGAGAGAEAAAPAPAQTTAVGKKE